MLISGFLPVLRFKVMTFIALLVALSSSLLLLPLLRNLFPIFIGSLLLLFSLDRLFQDVFCFFTLLLRSACSTSRIVVDSFIFGLIYISISHVISIHPMVMQALDMLQVISIADQTPFIFFLTLIR